MSAFAVLTQNQLKPINIEDARQKTMGQTKEDFLLSTNVICTKDIRNMNRRQEGGGRTIETTMPEAKKRKQLA